SWGESTFIQHSLNEANAVDLRTLRNPGAELKEAFIPAKMLWASLDLSESIALEAFYQFEWEPVRTDEPGTYFATRDFLGRTGYQVHLGFAQIPEGTPGTVARRVADRPADDNGQYGLKMAYFTEGGTEFGFYYMNYHNRRPIISANVHNGVEVQGFLEYPEDIRMSGISFNTATDGGLSVAGELSYRQDEPLQVDDAELLFATLAPVLDSVDPNTSQLGVTTINDLGREISGYRLHDTIQGQITFTNLLGSTLGSDETAFVFELGANYIRDLPNQNVLRYEVEGTLRSGNPDRAGRGAFFGELEGLTENEFANTFSWGYRTALRWNYNNMFAGWNMAPRLVYQHDVKGNTPAPISNFLEGRKALSLGVSFDYQSTWKIDFAYNRFFGAESANLIHDRDYVSLAFSYSI
ncbi:MAG: DUF1302 domain-containing protein, partial [Kangiellaceae bacterium]|nr:DUF1302 domain-containing protein [Kangiellaceae bacterium]